MTFTQGKGHNLNDVNYRVIDLIPYSTYIVLHTKYGVYEVNYGVIDILYVRRLNPSLHLLSH
jgi:hypothetical protein